MHGGLRLIDRARAEPGQVGHHLSAEDRLGRSTLGRPAGLLILQLDLLESGGEKCLQQNSLVEAGDRDVVRVVGPGIGQNLLVPRLEVRHLVRIAQGVGEPEVCFVVVAPTCERYNVLDFESRHGEILGTEAVSATIAGLGADAPLYCCRDGGAWHATANPRPG